MKGALKTQVQHFWEKMLHGMIPTALALRGAKLHAVEY